MSESYHVRVAQDYLAFNAAHFITFEGGQCEPLHGHTYRVAAEVHGPLDENHYVVDFLILRDAVKAICDELDHRVLLPTGHASIRVEAGEEEVVATFQDRRWVFPRAECVLLEVPNTTTELLARHVGRRLLEELAGQAGVRPARVRVEIAEEFGQWGVCELCDE